MVHLANKGRQLELISVEALGCAKTLYVNCWHSKLLAVVGSEGRGGHFYLSFFINSSALKIEPLHLLSRLTV